MAKTERREIAQRLMVWASAAPSAQAKALISELSDVHAAARKAAELIESLGSHRNASDQARVIAQLEVWLFDELDDRLATLKPKLEAVSKELSEVAAEE